MPNRTIHCGARKKRGGTCGNPVKAYGGRCYKHRSLASPSEFFRTCIRTATRVVAGGIFVHEALKLYEVVGPLLDRLGSLLAPEDFWVQYQRKDLAGMRKEIAQARAKRYKLMAKYAALTPKQRHDVMTAYAQIEAMISTVQDAA